jgi:hypothetical protein
MDFNILRGRTNPLHPPFLPENSRRMSFFETSRTIYLYIVWPPYFSDRRLEGVMKIRIVPAVGGGNPIELEVSPSTTIGAIRAKVCAMKKLPPDTTRLTYRGRALKDVETLESIGVQDGDKLILITRTVGG